MNARLGSKDVSNKYPTTGIYSDVDINFHSEKLSSVTSLTLDEKSESRRSSNDLPKQINQLLIDIQALDDADVAFAVREHPELAGKDLGVEERMPRFTSAFDRMFDGLTYNQSASGWPGGAAMSHGSPMHWVPAPPSRPALGAGA